MTVLIECLTVLLKYFDLSKFSLAGQNQQLSLGLVSPTLAYAQAISPTLDYGSNVSPTLGYAPPVE